MLHKSNNTGAFCILNNISIILVGTKLADNFVLIARILSNFDLFDLRLVSPLFNPHDEALVRSSRKGGKIAESCKIFQNFEEAICDMNILFATTARSRDMTKKVYNSKTFCSGLSSVIFNSTEGGSVSDAKIGILFGPEDSGLTNYHISICDAIIEIEASQSSPVLNIASACAIICYEMYNNFSTDNSQKQTKLKDNIVAEKLDIVNLMNVIQQKIQSSEKLTEEGKKRSLIQNLTSIFSSANMSKKDIQTIYGLISLIK